MKRKFLEDLGIETDMIDKIMSEHQKSTDSISTERNTYRDQLSTANETLKTFEGMDVDELQGKIKQLETDLQNKDTEINNKLAEIEFNSSITKAINGYGARNDKAVMALLDVDALKTSKNQDADIKSALDAVKEENGYLFTDVTVPKAVASTPGIGTEIDNKTQANQAFRALIGRGE